MLRKTVFAIIRRSISTETSVCDGQIPRRAECLYRGKRQL